MNELIDNKLFEILPTKDSELKITADLVCKESESLKEEFVCPICLNILFNPVSCSECEVLYCVDCIGSVFSKKCPTCSQIFKPHKLQRKLKNILDNILIECPFKCKSKLNYINLTDHFKKCNLTKIITKCLGCLIKVEDTNSLLNTRSHLNNCDKAYKTCLDCSIKYVFYKEHTLKECINNVKIYYTKLLSEKEKLIENLQTNDNESLLKLIIKSDLSIIFVRNTSEENITIKYIPDYTVLDIKKKIEKRISIPLENQQLFYKSILLDDYSTLFNLKINKFSEIQLKKKNDNEIKIFVKFNSKYFTMFINQKTSVEKLKFEFEGFIGLNDKKGKLTFKDSILVEKLCLIYYGIISNCTLNYII